jgi:hypothetical protein
MIAANIIGIGSVLYVGEATAFPAISAPDLPPAGATAIGEHADKDSVTAACGCWCGDCHAPP